MPAPGDHSITSNKLKRKSPDGPQDLDLDSAFKKLKGAVHTVQESIHDKDKVVGELRSQIDRLERKILDYQQELDEGHIAKLQTKMNGMEEEMKKLKADKFRARFDRGQAERSLVKALADKDTARFESQSAVVELGKAAQDRDAALKERDTALRERDTALSEREAAWAERGAVKRDLDSMWKAQDAALKHLGDAPRSNALSRTDSRDG